VRKLKVPAVGLVNKTAESTHRLDNAVASTRVQSWGGRSAEGGRVLGGEGCSRAPVERGQIFCHLEIAYFGEF